MPQNLGPISACFDSYVEVKESSQKGKFQLCPGLCISGKIVENDCIDISYNKICFGEEFTGSGPANPLNSLTGNDFGPLYDFGSNDITISAKKNFGFCELGIVVNGQEEERDCDIPQKALISCGFDLPNHSRVELSCGSNTLDCYDPCKAAWKLNCIYKDKLEVGLLIDNERTLRVVGRTAKDEQEFEGRLCYNLVDNSWKFFGDCNVPVDDLSHVTSEINICADDTSCGDCPETAVTGKCRVETIMSDCMVGYCEVQTGVGESTVDCVITDNSCKVGCILKIEQDAHSHDGSG